MRDKKIVSNKLKVLTGLIKLITELGNKRIVFSLEFAFAASRFCLLPFAKNASVLFVQQVLQRQLIAF